MWVSLTIIVFPRRDFINVGPVPLEAYSTPAQVGGKFDTMCVILAVILHVQLRQQQDLATYLLFADLKQAYDTASHDVILTTCFLAGVVQTEWKLLQDFLSKDSAFVTLGSAVSDILLLRAGVPQGRKFAVHAFTAFMRLLQAVLTSVCNPAATVLPDFAADAISGLWAHLTPLPLAPIRPGVMCAASAAQHLANAWSHGASPTEMRRIAIHVVANMPVHECINSMELLGSQHLGPLLFIDDVVASFASARDVEFAAKAGLETFAQMVKACFNMGPTKTAVMPCVGAAVPDLPDITCSSYKLLRVHLDCGFTFESRLGFIIRVGRALFKELFVLLRHTGFPPPVISLAVAERVEPVVLYGAEILPLIPESYKQLDAVQSDWARAIIADQGGRPASQVRGALAVAQVGWTTRLGTKALSKALMYLAKVELLPLDSPVVRMLQVAQGLSGGTWLHAAKEALAVNGMECPSLAASGLVPPDLLEQARHDSTLRRSILRRYKLLVLHPQAKKRDDAEFMAAAAKHLPGFACDCAAVAGYPGL